MYIDERNHKHKHEFGFIFQFCSRIRFFRVKSQIPARASANVLNIRRGEMDRYTNLSTYPFYLPTDHRWTVNRVIS